MEEDIICRPEEKILAENRKNMLIKLKMASWRFSSRSDIRGL